VLLLVLLIAGLLLAPVEGAFTTSTGADVGRATAGSWRATSTLSWAGANDVGQAGQTGTQDTVAARTPTPVADSGTFRQVVTGAKFACALRAVTAAQPADTAVCWGYDTDGQNGTGSTTGRFTSTPQPVSGGATWRTLAAGSTAACGVQTDRSLWCWGWWSNAQLGTVNLGSQEVPKPVPSSDTKFWADVSGGGSHFCALDVGGHLSCWGDNSSGAIGIGTTTTGPENKTGVLLTAVEPDATWSSVSAGRRHTCAVGRDGTLVGGAGVVAGGVYCWGSATYGQLGAGTSDQYRPTLVATGDPARTFTSVAAGAKHTCALSADRLWCWGRLPGGPDTPAAPQQLSDTWSAVAVNPAGTGTTCAVKTTTSELRCVGDNTAGILADGSTAGRSTAQAVLGGRTWSSASLGENFGCGLDPTGVLSCWGGADFGQVGTGAQWYWSTLQVVGAGPEEWSSVSSTTGHTCGLRGTEAWCWGANARGQLGNGSTSDTGVPQRVVGGTGRWRSINPGEAFTCGVDDVGGAWCWGYQRLGTGSADITSQPQQVLVTGIGMGTGTWVALDAGWNSACGIRSDATLWCWGENGHGQLGTGGTAFGAKPARVGTAADWTGVEVGAESVCATRRGGSLWCWGKDDTGQIGDGTTRQVTSTPVQVAGTWADVALGANHVCAVDVEGRMWCWGENSAGQHGDGTTTRSLTPTLAAGSTQTGGRRWTTVTAGGASTCAVGTDGSTYCFGSNYRGAFGLGVFGPDVSTPRVLPGARPYGVSLSEQTMWVLR
jgi:alpha-tubulin suppressor-like RCC1 family protein